MKILIVSQYFWPENFRINDLAIGLKSKGHSVSVLTGVPNYPDGKIYKGYSFFSNDEIYEGIKIYRSPMINRGNGNSFRLFLNYFSYAFFASIKSLFIQRNKFDIIFVYEPSPITVVIPAIIIKKLKKIPLVLWVQDLWPESIEAVNVKLPNIVFSSLNKFVSYAYSKCDKILVTSKGYINSITQKNINIDKLMFFPQWAEPIFRPIDKDDQIQKIMPSGFIVMFAGNIGTAQDFKTIIKAANIVKNDNQIHWVIIGSGRMKDYVDKEIKRLELDNVHMIGRYPLDDMPKFFAFADLLLISLKKSRIFSLTIPAKIQAYLACGRPILSMLEGEGAKIIEDAKAGINFSPGDYNSLAKGLLRIKNEKAELSKMGLNARNYYLKNFDRDKLLEKLIKELNNLVL